MRREVGSVKKQKKMRKLFCKILLMQTCKRLTENKLSIFLSRHHVRDNNERHGVGLTSGASARSQDKRNSTENMSSCLFLFPERLRQ